MEDGLQTKNGSFKTAVELALPVLVPLLVLLAATALACILAYVVILLGVDLKFRFVIIKLSQLFLVLSIFPAMRYLRLNKADLGFAPWPIFLKQVAQGASLGFVTLVPVYFLLYGLDVNVIDGSQPWTFAWAIPKIIIGLLLALLISLFEEPVFRGILLVGLSKPLSRWMAIAVSSFYYASLHFLDSKTQIPPEQLSLSSGFKLLGEAFSQLLNPDIVPTFFCLFVVGVFLGVLKTQARMGIGLCIGCHASWVWLIKLGKSAFNSNPNSEYLFLISNSEGVLGYLVAVWLSLAVAGYCGYRRLKNVAC